MYDTVNSSQMYSETKWDSQYSTKSSSQYKEVVKQSIISLLILVTKHILFKKKSYMAMISYL